MHFWSDLKHCFGFLWSALCYSMAHRKGHVLPGASALLQFGIIFPFLKEAHIPPGDLGCG